MNHVKSAAMPCEAPFQGDNNSTSSPVEAANKSSLTFAPPSVTVGAKRKRETAASRLAKKKANTVTATNISPAADSAHPESKRAKSSNDIDLVSPPHQPNSQHASTSATCVAQNVVGSQSLVAAPSFVTASRLMADKPLAAANTQPTQPAINGAQPLATSISAVPASKSAAESSNTVASSLHHALSPRTQSIHEPVKPEPLQIEARQVDSLFLVRATRRPSANQSLNNNSAPSTASSVPVRKLYCFDLDSTLITSRSQRKFAQHHEDWQWLYPKVIQQRLREIHEEHAGNRIVIFSNQGGVGSKAPKLASLKAKLLSIVDRLGVPVVCCCALAYDYNRKPSTGMFRNYLRLCEPQLASADAQFDFARDALFVGDAAGRIKSSSHSTKDFAASDRAFAANAGIPFATPEEFFLNHPVNDNWTYNESAMPKCVRRLLPADHALHSRLSNVAPVAQTGVAAQGKPQSSLLSFFKPSAAAASASAIKSSTTPSAVAAAVNDSDQPGRNVETPSNDAVDVMSQAILPSSTANLPPVIDFANVIRPHTEIVLLVGPPAASKSTLTRRFFEPPVSNYVRVNQDTLGTRDKCLKLARESLAQGKSVIVDNTNSNSATRALYVQLAAKHSVPCRCIYLSTPLELAQHLNVVRERMSLGAYKRIPSIAYRTYSSRFEMPSTDEGLTEVHRVDFVPVFESEEHRNAFFELQ